jgi:hypothetical protein
VTNSFDIATEGLLQNGDGQCLKTVVRTDSAIQVAQSTHGVLVSREPGGSVVASSVVVPVTVTPATTQTVSAERVDTHVVVAPGCGNSSAPSGPADWGTLLNKPATFPPDPHVHDYEDLTGVPAEFPPEAHAHTIANVTGLEQRLLADGAAFTYDIDSANTDDGVTDPYVYKTTAAAFNHILTELLPRLPEGIATVTVRLGNGDWPAYDFTYLITYGAPDGIDGASYGYLGRVAYSNARFLFESKSTPTAIADNEWYAIASPAVYNAQYAAAAAVNKPLLLSRFPCRVRSNASVTWQEGYLLFPDNFRFSGMAFVADGSYAYLRLGNLGAKPVAAYGTSHWYNDIPVSEWATLSGYWGVYNADGAVAYIVHGGCEFSSLSPSNVTQKIAIVNPYSYGATLLQSPFYELVGNAVIWSVFAFIGAKFSSTASWISVAAQRGVYLRFSSGSVFKSGEVALEVYEVGKRGSQLGFGIDGGSASGSGMSIKNVASCAIACSNLSALSARHSLIGGFFQHDVYNSLLAYPKRFWGTGSPNGVIVATLGDTYINQSGGANTTLWVKESGVNTNTGWVAK